MNFFYLIKNKLRKNKSFYKICLEVINILGGGYYIKKILNDHKDFNLRKEDKFEVSLNLLKNCDIDTFSNIMKLHSVYKNNYKDIINSENSDKLSIESDSNSYEEKNKVI